MKNTKGLIGLATFVVSMWAVVVVTYAAKQTAGGDRPITGALPMAGASCSSSSSSSSSGE